MLERASDVDCERVHHEECNIACARREHHVSKIKECNAVGEAAVKEGIFDVCVAMRQRKRRAQALANDIEMAAAEQW